MRERENADERSSILEERKKTSKGKTIAKLAGYFAMVYLFTEVVFKYASSSLLKV